MPSTFQTADGLTLAYDDQGTGTPVLCLAGLTRNMADFEPVVEHFADRARIIRLDSRGRGASDFDPEFQNYTIPQEGADALTLLDHLGLERTAILGTSRGGLIALVLAATARRRLMGVLFNDIGPDIDPKGLEHIMQYLGRPPVFESYDDAATRLPHAMGKAFPGVSHETWRRYAERVWREGPDGLELRYDPKLRDAVEAQGASGGEVDLWPFFDALAGLPLAVLRGENSDILSAQTLEKMCERRPDMEATTLSDRGHVPFLDEPESIMAIARWLARVEAMPEA